MLALDERATAQLIPVFRRHTMESLDHTGSKLSARPVVQFGCRRFITLRLAVHAVARDRIEGIRHLKDSGIQIYLFSAEAQRIARPIPSLMMLRHDSRRPGEKLYP